MLRATSKLLAATPMRSDFLGNFSRHFASSTSSQSTNAVRDVTVSRTDKQAIALLRRVADAMESGKSWRLTVDKKVCVVPTTAKFSVEHETEPAENEAGIEQCLELQFKWIKHSD